MADKIILVSDDSDFFDYIRLKLELRKSDELFMYAFDDIPEKIHLLEDSLIIVNSENSHEKTIELIKIFHDSPVIVMAYNEDEGLKKKCYRAGAFDFMHLLIPDAEFRARILPALSIVSLINKNKTYREILVKNNILSKQNEVFLDFANIIEDELKRIKNNSEKAVFAAISPGEKNKFFINPNQIETVILNNIRKNDILMNYAPNKYFLLVLNSDLKSAQKLWQKISSQLPQKVYAGFSSITNQNRQQLINEVLNKLHEAITYDKEIVNEKRENINALEQIRNKGTSYTNFKLYRQQFGQKIEQIITPIFYGMQQKYADQLTGMIIEQSTDKGAGGFYIKGKHFASSFRITSPGFAKINIDITLQKDAQNIDTKRISLEPEELEPGLLSDLVEQFISEAKNMA